MHIDFIKHTKVYFIISIALIVIALGVTAVFGVGLDIQFKGGSIITFGYEGELSQGDFESAVEELAGVKVNVQRQEDVATGATSYVVTSTVNQGMEVEQQEGLIASLRERYPENNLSVLSINNVDATIGQEFFLKCLVAVLLAFVLMVVYVAFRFRRIGGWSAGVMAVVALLHDVFMVYATFVIAGIPLNDNFIAVVLTILGYSLNDTIVIYDRVRENKKGLKRVDYAELFNTSMNQSFTRSVNTSVATALVLVVVCVFSLIYHVDSIFTFALPMMVGVVSGAYSSICIAGPLWVIWQNHKLKVRAAKA